MERTARLVLGVVAVAGSLCAVVDVKAQPGPSPFIYPVKFLCGSILGEKIDIPDQTGAFEPNMGTPATEPPVKPGNYATAVNIYNFQNKAVTFTKRSAIANPQGQPRGQVSATFTEVLQPGEALEVDCPNINAMFKPKLPSNGNEYLPRFAKGFMTVESPVELQVVGVYTAEKMEIVHKSTCDPAPIVINTGWSGRTTTGPIIPTGGTDDDWRVVNVPSTWFNLHTTSITPYLAPVVVGHSAWGSPFTSTQWISVLPNLGSPFPTGPPNVFEYEVRFSLGPSCTNALLSMRLKADDIVGVCTTTTCTTLTPGVFLNGVPVDSQGATFTPTGTTSSAGGNFSQQPLGVTLAGPVSSTGPFHPGSNVLTVKVSDTGQAATGLDVAGSVTPAGGSVSVGAGVGLSLDVEYVTAKRRLP